MNLSTAQAIALQGPVGRGGAVAFIGGCVYVASGDPGWLMSYDPVKGAAVTHGQANDPAYPAELRDRDFYEVAVAHDGRLALGTYGKGGIQIYNPKTGTITPYGSADPADTTPRYTYSLMWDEIGSHVYACVRPNATDDTPMYYYLAALDVATGQYTLHFKDELDSDAAARMGKDGKAYYYRKAKTGTLWYRLKSGVPVLLKATPDTWDWNNPTGTMNRTPAQWNPAVDLTDEFVTGNHPPTIRWDEQTVTIDEYGFNLEPYALWRVASYGDHLLAGTQFYGPLVEYDPVSDAILGRYTIAQNIYQIVPMSNGLVALTGYASAVLLWDTTQPWTASDAQTDATTNPRTIAGVAKYHRWAAYHEGTQQLYVFGEELRDDVGTTLARYSTAGELLETLKDETWGAHGLVALPNAIVVSESEHGQLVVITPGTMDVARTVTVWNDASTPGAIVGVGETGVVCVAGTRAALVNIATGTVLWRVDLPNTAWEGWGYWYDYLPEYGGGYVWFPCGGKLYKLAVANGAVTLTADENLNARKHGRDLYLYGGTTMKRITNVFDA